MLAVNGPLLLGSPLAPSADRCSLASFLLGSHLWSESPPGGQSGGPGGTLAGFCRALSQRTAHSAQSVWVRGEAGHAVVPLMQSSFTEKGVWPWKQQ